MVGFVALAGFEAEDGFVDGGGDVTLVTLVIGDETGSTAGAVGGGGGSTGTGVGGVVAEVVVVVAGGCMRGRTNTKKTKAITTPAIPTTATRPIQGDRLRRLAGGGGDSPAPCCGFGTENAE